ncbi:MAG: hypothetical protein AAGJ86_07805 [Pseudomonadota bacterium]
MAALSGSGMTVIEAPIGDQPIAIYPTPTAAFLGRAAAGPVNAPVVVDSVTAFDRVFGGEWSDNTLAEQVRLFFQHGGQRAIIVRLCNSARCGELTLPADGVDLRLTTRHPGSAERVRASVDYDGIKDDRHFNLTLQRVDASARHILDQEIYANLSIDAEASLWFGHALADSALVRLPAQPALATRPLATRSQSAHGGVAYQSMSLLGDDGTALTDYDFVGSERTRTGLFALDLAPDFDALYACADTDDVAPGPTFVVAATQYCASRNAMLLVDPPPDDDADAIVRWRHGGALDSEHVLTYFPRLRRRDDATASASSAAGALMGLLLRHDAQHHVFTALADSPSQNAALLHRDWLPSATLTTDDALTLLRVGVNPLVVGERRRLVFPALVTAANRRERRQGSLPDQRLKKFVLRQIERGTRWAVFRKRDETLWMQVADQVSTFMQSLAELGAFAEGRGNAQSWSVRCDAETNAGVDGVRLLIGFRSVASDSPFMFAITQHSDGTTACRTAFTYPELA